MGSRVIAAILAGLAALPMFLKDAYSHGVTCPVTGCRVGGIGAGLEPVNTVMIQALVVGLFVGVGAIMVLIGNKQRKVAYRK